jgi:hypothetical protein
MQENWEITGEIDTSLNWRVPDKRRLAGEWAEPNAKSLRASTGRSTRVGSSLAQLQPVPPRPCSARIASPARSKTLARESVYDAVRQRLSQDLEALVYARGPFIRAQEAVVRQRPPRHGPRAAVDHGHIGGRMVQA